MSLRCSLLGHSYGEAEIEREREEQGSEVVVTVREFEECERCGEQNVLSENKEITAIESPAPDLESAEADPDVGQGPDAADSAGATGSAGGDAGPNASAPGVSDSAGPDVDSADDGAEIITDSADAAAGTDSPESASSDPASSGSSPDPVSSDPASSASGDAGVGAEGGASAADGVADASTAAEDDGVILDDDGSDASEGRQPGEWPEAETTHPAEADESGHAEWPDVGREDEGFDAEPGGGSADVEFGGGLTPESAPEVDDDETDEVEFVNADGDALRARNEGTSSSELSSGISAGAEAPSLSGPAEDPDVDAEFVCPECDYREAVSGSSLRAGDICPECAKGYLATE